MSFNFIKTNIEGVVIVEPKVFGDGRGYFMETYQKNLFDAAGLNYFFVQTNQSRSFKGVLRGLHFQTKKPQAKLVSVVEGEVFDAAVDLRKNSPTYGKYVGLALSSKNHKMLMIPRGFAHGFVVLSETAIFEYQVDNDYDPEHEGGIIWNDPEIGIDWPYTGKLNLSSKDQLFPNIINAHTEFEL